MYILYSKLWWSLPVNPDISQIYCLLFSFFSLNGEQAVQKIIYFRKIVLSFFSPSYIISQYQKKLLYQFSEDIFIFGIIYIQKKRVNLVIMLKLLIQSINVFNSRWFCWNLFKTAIRLKLSIFLGKYIEKKKSLCLKLKKHFYKYHDKIIFNFF